jgi:O-antigen ligase
MALFNRKLFIYTLCILGPLFLILGFDYNILSNQLFNRVLDFENYLYTRADTWSYSLEIISDYKLLFFGNGINNYSHNLFLHIITTQGIIYFLTIIIMIIFILKKVLTNPEINRNEIFFLFSIILIDWNVNTNIYMPYYAIYIALLLTMMSKSYQLTNKEDIIEKK